MEIKIFREGENVPVFTSLVSSIKELQGILAFVKKEDEKVGITTTYEILQASELAKQELSQATDSYFYSQAKLRGGYLNMGEIVHDAHEGDPDAQFLLRVYDAIWKKEEELEAQIDQMTLKELLQLDVESLAKKTYDAVVAELEDSDTDNTSTDSTTQDSTEG